MTPEPVTNARSYELPEGRIRRATSEPTSTRSNGESVKDAASRILHYDLPEPYSMDEVYRYVVRTLRLFAESNVVALVGHEADPMYLFDEVPDLDDLAQAQGVLPVQDIGDLAIDSWPDDESTDDFMAAVHRWRRESNP